MLLRQALEQTRTGMPAPVLFNSRLLARHAIDEASAMVQEELFDAHFDTFHNRTGIRSFLDDSAGQVRHYQPYRKAAVTGAQTS
jgi:hypothetical protein